MALGFDGSIRIDTAINTIGFTRGIERVNRGFNGLTISLKKFAGVVAAAFGVGALIKFGKEAIKASSDLSNAWMGLNSIVEGQGKSFRKAKGFINDYISDGLVPLENAVTAYKNLAARGYSTDQIEQVMGRLKDAAAFGRQSSYTLGEAIATATEGLKNENSILVDNAGVTKNVAKMWDEYAKSIGTTARNLTQQQKIQAEVNGIMEETKFQIGDAAKLAGTYSGQIAMLSFNFQQLKVAVGDALIPIAQAVLPGINAIIAALTKLANMFAKVTALLFGKSTKVVATNNKEISSTADAAAKSTDDLSKSLGESGKAAKKAAEEAETAVAAFDEFNILSFPDKSSSGGSGSGGGGGAGGAFDIPNVDDTIDDYEAVQEEFETLGDIFAKFLQDILDGMPKFKQALLDGANAFNEFNKKLYEAFKDPRILPLVEELGRELADALNGLVNAIDWNLWGRTLGAGLNLGLQFLTEFLYNFDWINLGRKLAAFINGLVAEIDWYDFGRLLWAGWKIALETLAGFLVGLNMPQLARAASDIVKGFFDEMYNTIQIIEWDEIGRQIARFLNNIDWYGTITSIFKAISAAFNALAEMVRNFVDTLKWGDIAKQIYTAINDSLGQVDWHALGKALGDLFINAFNFLREIIAGINWFQIGQDIADFLNGIDWGKLAEAIFGALKEAFLAALSFLAGFLSKASPDSIVAALALFFGTVFGEKILKHVKLEVAKLAKNIASELFTNIKTALAPMAGKIAEALSSLIEIGNIFAGAFAIIGGVTTALKSFFLMLTEGFSIGKELAMLFGIALTAVGAIIIGFPATVVAAVAGIVAAVSTLIVAWDKIWEGIKNIVKNALDAIGGFIIGIKDYFAQKMEECGGNIIVGLARGIADAARSLARALLQPFIDFADAVLEFFGVHSPSTMFAEIGRHLVEGLIQGIKETWSGVLEFFQEKVNAIIDFFTGAWDGIKEKTAAAWEAIKTTLGGIWDSIKEKAVESFEAIREKILDAWDKLKEKTKQVWDGIKTTLSTLWDNIKAKAKEIFDGIKETISTIWDNIKSKTDEVWNNIKTFLSTLWDNLKTTVKTIFENIKTTISTIWENVKSKTTEIWNSIKTTLTTLWNELKNTVINTFNEIKNKIVEVWTTIKNEAIAKWNEIKSTIAEKINNIKQTVSEGFAQVKESIVSKVTEAINTLKSMDWLSVGRSIVNGIANGLNGIFDKLKSWATRVWDTVSNAFNGGSSRSGSFGSSRTSAGSFSRSASTYSAASLPAGYHPVQLPKLANGAVIPPNQQFMAILGDQRSGVNVEAPLSTIEKAVQNVLDRNGGIGGDIHITVESVLDGRVVARNTVKHINDMTTAAGRPVLLV